MSKPSLSVLRRNFLPPCVQSTASILATSWHAEIELETGRGSARISCASDRAHRERVLVRARGRRVVASAEGGAAALLTSRLPWREHPLVASLRAQLVAFVAATRGEDPGLLATAADGVATMRVIDAVREHAA